MRSKALTAIALLAGLLLFVPAGLTQAPVTLPADEAAHPRERSERWEVAGHLRTSTDRTFALLAAFRRGDHPSLGKGSLLTLAIVDLDSGLLFVDVNLISNPSAEMAPKPLSLSWEGSYLHRLPEDGGLRLLGRGVDDGSRTPIGADLVMTAVKPSSFMGSGGMRPFGSSDNNAFQHATSRMEAKGTLVLQEVTYPVEGVVWFTHLWGPFDGTGKAFDAATIWTAHLADGRDLRIEAFSGVKKGRALPATATWISEDGTVREEPLTKEPKVTKRWRSLRGVLYPVEWKIPLAGGKLTCRARIPNGEVLYEVKVFWTRWTSLSWIGSCALEGRIDGEPVEGEAVVEATGFEP